MTDSEELRGSTPIYTAKDILVRLDDKVEKMDLKIDGALMSLQILVSQNLNERVMKLENEGSTEAQEALYLARTHDKKLTELNGMGLMLKALFGTNLLFVLYVLYNIMLQVGVFN